MHKLQASASCALMSVLMLLMLKSSIISCQQVYDSQWLSASLQQGCLSMPGVTASEYELIRYVVQGKLCRAHRQCTASTSPTSHPPATSCPMLQP